MFRCEYWINRLKMFNKILLLFLLIVTKASSFRLIPNDFCFAIETDCRGSYEAQNRYRNVCEHLCHGKFGYKCGSKLCSANETVCDEYFKIKESLNPFFNTIYHEIEKVKFNLFNSIISDCSIWRAKWLSSDICINGKNCIEKQKIHMRSGFVNYQKKIECQCRGNHTYYCGKDYCAKSKNSCNDFYFKFNGFIKPGSLKNCGNNNTVTERLF